MASGFKVADAYIEVHLDDSTAKREVSQLPQRIGGDTEKAGTTVGRRLGQAIGDGTADGFQRSGSTKVAAAVENLSARLEKARRAEKGATDAIKLSELRLTEARENGNVTGSRLLALEQSVERARARGTDAASSRVAVERALGSAMADAARAVGPDAQRGGEDAGTKLAQGMHLAIVRNSPLIAAGIGAALAVGAPAAIAGAGVLFAGIGIAAAAQNEVVKAAWGRTWSEILTGTQKDASVLQATVANMALKVSAAFEQMRPLMREAFSALAPIIDSFTNSLLKAAQNALPGLVHAVQAAGPVFDGLGSLVEDIGTGLGKFFDIISEHSQAAGTAFAAIGDILGTLLPVLGDLLGAGAELASAVLPPLAAALRVVGDVLHFIAPILPEVAIGFAAFKAVQALSGPIDSFAGGLTKLVDGFKGLVSGPGSPVAAKSGLDSFKGALGPVGLALGLVGAAIVAASQQIDEWANALLAGGNAAEQATAQMQGIEDFFNNGLTGVGSAVMGWTNWANALGVGSNASQTAKERAQELYDAMTPLQQANQDVTTAQNNLNVAIDQFGPHSLQANEALLAYNNATAAAQAQQSALELAINGVTEAMVAQANQALAAASSQFAYDSATQQVIDAQSRLHELQTSGTASTSELNNATNSLNQALLSQAEAAGRLASDALPATASELDRNAASASATLQELYRLRDTMGSEFPAALQHAIVGLEQSGAATSNFSGQAQVGIGIVQDLVGHLGILGNQHPVPTADLNPSSFNINWGNAMTNIGILASQHPQPSVSIYDAATGPLTNIKRWIDSLYSKTITITTVQRTVSNILGGLGGNAAGGAVNDIPVIKAASGRVVGRGTGTSDSVPAIGPSGQRWALSNGEWVVRDAAVRALERAYGPSAMPTINSGRLPVATSAGTSGSMAKVQGGGITIQSLTVQISGTYDLAHSSDLRKAAQRLEQELIKLGREQR